jgi:hypothetical protein
MTKNRSKGGFYSAHGEIYDRNFIVKCKPEKQENEQRQKLYCDIAFDAD